MCFKCERSAAIITEQTDVSHKKREIAALPVAQPVTFGLHNTATGGKHKCNCKSPAVSELLGKLLFPDQELKPKSWVTRTHASSLRQKILLVT